MKEEQKSLIQKASGIIRGMVDKVNDMRVEREIRLIIQNLLEIEMIIDKKQSAIYSDENKERVNRLYNNFYNHLKELITENKTFKRNDAALDDIIKRLKGKCEDYFKECNE